MNNKIEELFSDSGIFDEPTIVEIIKPFIIIQKRNNKIFFLKQSEKLNTNEKILVYCLVKKLLKNNGKIEDDSITAKEFYEDTGIKKGTIDPAFKKLRENNWLIGKKGKYEVPNYNTLEIIERLKSKLGE